MQSQNGVGDTVLVTYSLRPQFPLWLEAWEGLGLMTSGVWLSSQATSPASGTLGPLTVHCRSSELSEDPAQTPIWQIAKQA